MELNKAQFSNFINSPNRDIRIFLIYGQDEGLVRERGKKVSLTTVQSLDDPFAYVELSAKDIDGDPSRIRDEIEAISMMGDDRVIRFRDAGNAHTKLIQSLFDANFSNSILVIETGDLKKTGSLVKAVSSLDFGAAIPCYHDKAQDVQSLIKEVLSSFQLNINSDAMDYLRTMLGSDRAISRQELEKLCFYKGKSQDNITLEDVQAVIGDSSVESVFDVIDATLSGNMDRLEYTINKAFFTGESPITLLRLLQNQLKQLHKVSALSESGTPLNIAVKKAGIPPFGQQKAQAQIGRKGSRHFAMCLEITLQAEIECKKTGAPAETICRRALMRICMASR